MWTSNTDDYSVLRTDPIALGSAFLRLAHNMRAPPISVVIESNDKAISRQMPLPPWARSQNFPRKRQHQNR